MLENINLTRKLSREEYKRVLPGLQLRLYDLEKACWDAGAPTMVVFEGLDAAGKGTAIAALTERLDPRGFRLSEAEAEVDRSPLLGEYTEYVVTKVLGVPDDDFVQLLADGVFN